MYHIDPNEEFEEEEERQMDIVLNSQKTKTEYSEGDNSTRMDEAVTQITTAAHSLCTEKASNNTTIIEDRLRKEAPSEISTTCYDKNPVFNEGFRNELPMSFHQENVDTRQKRNVSGNGDHGSVSTRVYYHDTETQGGMSTRDIHSLKKNLSKREEEIHESDLNQGEWVRIFFIKNFCLGHC